MRKLVFIAFIVGPLLAGCTSDTAPTAQAAAPTPVSVSPPAVSQDIVGSGPIIVEQQVDVLAQREGDIVQFAADLGSAVSKGQLLAKLDDRQLTAQHEALEAKVRSIAADLKNWEALTQVADAEKERAEQMWKAQLMTQQDREKTAYKAVAARYEVERQQQDLKQAQAELRALELELAKTQVVAPFSGVVARRYITVGQHVAAGERLFYVSATGPMRVRFMLPEKWASQVKDGTELAIQSPDQVAPEMKARARVVRMSPIVDPASGTIEAVAEIIGDSAGLRPGMTATLVLPKR